MTKNVNDWNRLAMDAYIGGAIRERDNRGRVVHRRIAKVEIEPGIASFHFDRVAVMISEGTWAELPLEGNDYLWFPSTMMEISFDDAGIATLGSPQLPSYIDAIHPKTSLPAASPSFAKLLSN